MPRVSIDISLLTHTSNVGVIHGPMELETVPVAGDAVTFDRPIKLVKVPDVPGFTPRVVVEHVLPPVPGSSAVLLSLADITVASRADALKVAEFFQLGYGLYFDDHDLV